MIGIDIINFQHPDREELLKLRGNIFTRWLKLWDSLYIHEKEIYSHPVYVISWINARQIHTKEEILVFVFTLDSEFIGAIPFTVKTFPSQNSSCCYLKSPMVELGSTLAIPEKFRTKIFEKLFQTPLVHGHKPIAITFDRIDETNSFITEDVGTVTIKTGYTRNVLNLSDGYQALLKKRSGHFRKNLKERYIRLEKKKE